MYNKVLKRPMFNMGGRINQAAGTGITSGLDTPRRGLVQQPGGYAGRTADEIEAEILKLYPEKTANQRGFDILESYGNLPSARKDGEYRTIGERLDMRSESFEKKLAEETALKNKARLTILEADQAKNIADQLAADALERTKVSTTNPLNKDYSVKRQISDLTLKLTENAAKNMGAIGSEFILAGYGTGVAIGQVAINELQGGDEIVRASVIPLEYFQKPKGSKQWGFDSSLLAQGMVYWDPIQQSWLTVDSKGAPIYTNNYKEAAGNLNLDSEKTSATSSSTDIKVEKTDGIKTISLHPVKDGSTEVTDEYVLQYIEDNNIITDAAEYRAIEDKENYTLLSINQVKIKLKKENIATVRQEETDKKTYARKEREALNWFKRNYERYKNGNVQMPDRFQEFEEVYLGTLAVKVAEKPEELAAGGRAGYAMGSPEFQGEVVTEELEEIQPDSGVDELADLQTWWKSEIEKDFNS